ncbi:MAG: hypothetical protein IVW54_16250 [Candidatus Binataceae bacterium]|nr:hypothetical protein [Candidatus Binataceae bacterium]
MKTKIPPLSEFRKQRTTETPEEHLAVTNEVPSPTGEPRCCWRCGAGPQQPSLDDQVALLKALHEQRTELFKWGDAEWRRLRDLLQPGDLLLVAGNYLSVNDPSYSEVRLRRGNEIILIDRRQLADA